MNLVRTIMGEEILNGTLVYEVVLFRLLIINKDITFS